MKRKKLQDISSAAAAAAENVEGNSQINTDAAPIDAYSDGDDSDDSEEETAFFKALQEMEGKDITQLKEMIMQEGEDLS